MDAIRTEGLTKRYGKTTALAGVDLAVPAGTIAGLLGPNGAGKTTVVRILATLLRPDAGRAEINGIDVLAHPAKVRPIMGLTGQYAAVDEDLSGWENLVLVGRLVEPMLSRSEARQRATGLLERFDLTSAAKRSVKTYSGGMRRRLDIAMSLVGRPRILFLDEPTTGLDPRSRGEVWDLVRGLAGEGVTVLLTTQYLDEADRLASHIAVMDEGRVVDSGPPAALKAKIAGHFLIVRPTELVDLARAMAIVHDISGVPPTADVDGGQVTVPIKTGDATATLAAVAGRLDTEGIAVSELGLRLASLDEVFLALTGGNR
jgi:oleandomycin transport system ATP-binding protein